MTLSTMRAVVADRAGGSDVLRLVDRPVPEPGSGEVRLRVAATAVNRADIAQREGRYPVPAGTTDVLGLEAAGTIDKLWPDVQGWAVGDSAGALLTGGGYAEAVIVPAAQLLPWSDGLDAVRMAALPEVMCTVYSNLIVDAGLRQEQTVLIHGGGSGIGTAAIQLVTALGATAYVTVGSAEKARRCIELGAAAAIDYRQQDFVAEIAGLTVGRGVDVVLDCLGGSYLDRNVAALAEDGTLVIIGLMGGARAELDIASLMRRRLAVRGSTLRARSAADKARIVAGTREVVWPLLASGSVAPIVDSIWPIEQVAHAHEHVEAGRNVGKVILTLGHAAAEPVR